MLPVIELAEKKIRDDGILPDYVKISWMKYDDQCDAAIATISAIDAYAKNCSHLIIGPSCEYCVCKFPRFLRRKKNTILFPFRLSASVSRIAKYFYNDGLNIITGGAFSFDFEEPKTSCDDQFHMLHRVGILSFERMAMFTRNLMRNFRWKRAAFVYERNGYFQVGGIQTCHL